MAARNIGIELAGQAYGVDQVDLREVRAMRAKGVEQPGLGGRVMGDEDIGTGGETPVRFLEDMPS
jgi:hypothetical protein